MNIQELAKRLFRLEFLSDDGFEIDINSPKFEDYEWELFQELEESEIITHKGFAEKFECYCGGFLEESSQDGIYFCGECGNFETINEERKLYKVDCESIFTMISNTLNEIVTKYQELKSLKIGKRCFFEKKVSQIGFLKNADLEIYFLHKKIHAQNFKKQKENAKTLIFTLDGNVEHFADYYISCGDILNDEGSFSLAKINAELFGVLSKVYANQNLKKEAAKFHTLHLLKSGSGKYKCHGGREKFIQDMMRDFQGVKQDYVEKLWKDYMKE